MRFPHPVAVACRICGHPTVLAETPTGFVRVHCGTWRWQCDTLDRAGADEPALQDRSSADPAINRWAA